MDYIALILVRSLCGVLSLLPTRFGTAAMAALLNLFFSVVPKYRRIARRNLALAFPEKDEEWREARLRESVESLARVLVDFARIPRIDAAWVSKSVDCSFVSRYEEIKRENPGKGIVLATGHLGSFELLAHCVAMYGHKISFVVRNFPLARVDRWWTSRREMVGNRVIGRRGAVKEILRDLQRGRDVAILFDQNVTRNHAVFVPWFGVPAATSRAVALSALRIEAPVVVIGIGYRGDGRYEVMAEECDFKPLYERGDLSAEDKVEQMTAEISTRYIGMIRRYPGEWFWMHRRWKTRPEGEAEEIYRV